MANAKVYVKWADQEDGDKGRGGWSEVGDASASGKGGIDQQVCPTCQRWMIVEVLGQLKVLHKTEGWGKLRWKVYAEVQHAEIVPGGSASVTKTKQVHTRVRVGRETTWPIPVGNLSEWQDLLPLVPDGEYTAPGTMPPVAN